MRGIEHDDYLKTKLSTISISAAPSDQKVCRWSIKSNDNERGYGCILNLRLTNLTQKIQLTSEKEKEDEVEEPFHIQPITQDNLRDIVKYEK